MRRTIERCASKSNDQTIGVGNGTGFSNTALTTVKIAVFVPVPSVSAATAAIVKPGLRLNNRNECATSLSPNRAARPSQRAAVLNAFRCRVPLSCVASGRVAGRDAGGRA